MNDLDGDNLCLSADPCPEDSSNVCNTLRTTSTVSLDATSSTAQNMDALEPWVIPVAVAGGIILITGIILLAVFCTHQQNGISAGQRYKTTTTGGGIKSKVDLPSNESPTSGASIKPYAGQFSIAIPESSLLGKRRARRPKQTDSKGVKNTSSTLSSCWRPDPQQMSPSCFERSLKEFFQKQNPKKLKNVPQMVEVYDRKREKLFEKLWQAYKVIPRFYDVDGTVKNTNREMHEHTISTI
jgi:hypothetical protein